MLKVKWSGYETRKETVFVCFKEHKRLMYSGSRIELKEREYQVFQYVTSSGMNIFLQIKDLGGDGVYLDLLDLREVG